MLQSPTTDRPTPLETRLIHIALALPKTTKRAAAASLRAAGLPGRAEYVEWMLERLALHEQWHASRHIRHANRRLSVAQKALRASNTNRTPVLLPEHTPTVRTNTLRTQAVECAAKSVLRWGASGGSEFSVRFAQAGEPTDYVVSIAHN